MKKYFFVLFLFSVGLLAQEKNYFYFGRDYGSDAMFNPIGVIINGGFDILQASTHTRDVSFLRIGKGFKNVWRNISNPVPQIEKYGWNKFISHEVFPTSLDIKKAQWFPNYTLHFIGGGLEYRANYEWFRHNNFSYPWVWSAATNTTYHLLNEAVENDFYQGVNVDPIADILIFNLGGAALFTNDKVAEFFSSTIQMADWSAIPAYNPVFKTLENHGQNFVAKYRPKQWDSTSIFTYWGDLGLVGLSLDKKNNEAISFGAGLVTRQFRLVDANNGTRTLTVEFGWIAGMFYDRNNSLLGSLILSNRINEKVKLNIYPGVINFKGFSPGLFINIGSHNQLIFGIAVSKIPLGLTYRNHL